MVEPLHLCQRDPTPPWCWLWVRMLQLPADFPPRSRLFRILWTKLCFHVWQRGPRRTLWSGLGEVLRGGWSVKHKFLQHQAVLAEPGRPSRVTKYRHGFLRY